MDSIKKLLEAKKNTALILNGSLSHAILSLTLPIVLNSIIQTMYNLTDTYWLGKIDNTPMAAITLVSPVQSILMNFGQGITVAGAILISQSVGAGKREDAKSMATHLFSCAMLFSLFCVTGCFLATPAILSWLGADGEIAVLGRVYLQIVLLDMPFLFTINIFTSVRQAQGDTIHPMLLNLLGVILNLLLDPLFLIVFHWGIAGAAFATLLAKIPCALLALFFLTRQSSGIFLSFRGFHFEKEKLGAIVRIGLPTAIGGSTMQFGFLLMSKNVLKYGTLAVTAYGIGNKINGLITTPSNGIGSATSTIVGQNIGAGQKDRAEQAYRLARRIAVLFLLAGGILLSRPSISRSIVSIFSENDEVIAMAADFLSIMALWCFTNGVYNTTMGLFQGSRHTMVTMAVDASRLWIFRFATLFFCETVLHLGVRSIWYSVVVSNALSALLLFFLFRTGLWRRDILRRK